MINILKILRNLIQGRRKFIKVDECSTFLLYKCRKCEEISKVHRYYGNLHVVCGCGNSTDIYTGKNIYKKPTFPTKNTNIKNKREHKIKLFERNIHADFVNLAEKLCSKRDIRRQQPFKKIEKLFKKTDLKSSCENLLRNLQGFCDLNDAMVRLTFKQLTAAKALRKIVNPHEILGITYTMPMGQNIFYTIYINPDYLQDQKRTIATLAHELSHVYAHYNNLNFKSPNDDRGDNEYNEQMTDLLGIALGMGSLLSNKNYIEDTTDTGYLSSELIFRAHELWTTKIISGVTPGIKTTINCLNCDKKLRIPITKKKLKLKCPQCDNSFEEKHF